MTNLKARVSKLEQADELPGGYRVVGGMSDRADMKAGEPFAWYRLVPTAEFKRLRTGEAAK